MQNGIHVPASHELVEHLRWEQSRTDISQKPLSMIEWHIINMNASADERREYSRIFDGWFAKLDGAQPSDDDFAELKAQLVNVAPAANGFERSRAAVAAIARDFAKRGDGATRLVREQLARLVARYPGAEVPAL